MICTSYFSNIKENVSEKIIPVSISRITPEWFNGISIKDVAPTPEILSDYNAGKISNEEYILRYKKDILDKLNIDDFIKHLSKETGIDVLNNKDKIIALCCYEKNGELCHRHLLADYLNEKLGLKIREANKGELASGKLKEEEKPMENKEKKDILGEVKEEMYGSVHSHAEDMFDTGNDLKEWILNFMRRGAKKVALTGHGSMFAYEDLKGILKAMKKDKEIPGDYPFDIIPGVEVYFTGTDEQELVPTHRESEDRESDEEEGVGKSGLSDKSLIDDDDKDIDEENTDKDIKSKHMVLIAKNYEGYVDLCKIISDASKNTKASRGNQSEDMEYLTPLVTMENLKKNVHKGNIIATSACVGGVFSIDLGMTEYNLREKLEKEKNKVGGEGFYARYEENKRIVAEYIAKKEDPFSKKPKAADLNKAKKVLEKTGDDSLLMQWEEHDSIYNANKNWLMENRDKVNFAKKEIGKAEKKMGRIDKAKEALDLYISGKEDRYEHLKEEYRELEDIFGKDNFYFELQNHTLPFEKTIFNEIVKMAYDVGNPHFIASNDVHIGDFKGSETWDKSVFKRKVERFKRFKNIEEDRGDEEEYGIKSDDELRAALLDIIEPYTDKEGVMHSPEDIVDEAIGNIKTVLEPCHVVFPEISVKGLNHYPKFCEDEGSKLRELVEAGVHKRFPNGLPEGYRDRIEYELNIIHSMGFDGYFLIVQDYLEYGKRLGYLRTKEEIDNAPLTTAELDKYIDEHNIPRVGMGIGPGRGSATGCLCSYLIEITELDPIPYGLFFERFLNPSRGSMPDIDSDFKDDIREKVYEYIKQHYGDECVSKVATKSYTHGKGAVLLMQQYMVVEYENELKAELDKDLKEKRKTMDPEDFQAYEKSKKNEIKEKVLLRKKDLIYTKGQISKIFDAYVKAHDINLTNHPEKGTETLKKMLKEGEFSEEQAKIVERAIEIAGIPATLGMHACACLISGDPLREVIPLAWNDKNQKMTTQCLYPQAEELGLLKMDLLNIKNLSVITRVMQETGDNRISDPAEVEKILKDERIYKEIYSAGKTLGIFQVESPGMTKMMKDFKPTCFEDIILLVAAYRPGPLAFIPEIIAVKRHLEDPDNNAMPERSLNIDNKELQDILAPTYGVPIYQEQVMQIFQRVAGYNLADADNVRRYMSKKKMEPLQKEKPFFIHGDPKRGIRGCVEAGLTEAEAELLFDKLVEFSKYAFNKSHAAAYAQVSMYTAYQKLYHPMEFYKHTLSNEIQDGAGKENPIAKYMGEMQSMGIGILPPMIGKSHADFEIEGKNIRIGYGNIKGQSYKDYNGDMGESIMKFIIKNPDVSLSAVSTFIKLGMFDKCWITENKSSEDEKSRVGGNRNVMLTWLEGRKETEECAGSPAYGSIVKDFTQMCGDINRLAEEVKNIEKDIRTLEEKDEDPEVVANLQAELEDKLGEKNTLWEKVNGIVEELKDARVQEMACPVSYETEEDKLNYRKYEVEALGFPFSLIKDADRLKESGNTLTYDNLMKKKEEILKDDRKSSAVCSIPAVVISATKKMSKKGNDYYVLQLMDGNKQVFTATLFNTEKPLSEKALFSIKYSKPRGDYGESITVDSIEELEFSSAKKKTNEGFVKLDNGETIRDCAAYLKAVKDDKEINEDEDFCK